LALASSEYLDAFLSHYKLAESEAFNNKSCGVCHVSDSDFSFNPYGRDLKKAFADMGASAVDGALLASIEALDSDADGKSNGDEISAGEFPGESSTNGEAAPTAAAKPEPFPPKNGYHPAIVHFPIALFIGGLILDFLGMVRKNQTLLAAGWYCIVMAAISSVGALVSGALAMSLLKLPYRGLIFEHLSFAVGATAIMWILVALRVDRHEKMNVRMRLVYYVLATACLAMISWAGHLGGVFVYGE
jgi:uncharacterized membrane protein